MVDLLIYIMKLVSLAAMSFCSASACTSFGSAWKDVVTLGQQKEKRVLWYGALLAGCVFTLIAYIALVELTPLGNTGASSTAWFICAVCTAMLFFGWATYADDMRNSAQFLSDEKIHAAGWTSPDALPSVTAIAEDIGWTWSDSLELIKPESEWVQGDEVEETEGKRSTEDDEPVRWIITVIVIACSVLTSGFLVAFWFIRRGARNQLSATESYLKSIRGQKRVA